MKMISKISKIVLALTLVGSSVFAQSLADAKKAIDAEQFQKAKSMLKNLTVTQATKDENFFYLGWVYILQEYPDSAKAVFQKGIAVNPKSALNYAGLGAAAFLDKDRATATTNFNQAIALAGKGQQALFICGRSLPAKRG
jgi:tetratricopeptide (TPR) repeat protein